MGSEEKGSKTRQNDEVGGSFLLDFQQKTGPKLAGFRLKLAVLAKISHFLDNFSHFG